MIENPIETDLQVKFWSSPHKSNKMKALIAFSKDEDSFNKMAMRYGYSRAWRRRAWAAFGSYVNNPSLVGVPFSDSDSNWWDEMPYI